MNFRPTILLLLSLISLWSLSQAEEIPEARVGQPLRIEEIHIPGSQLQPIPRRDRTPPLVIRILDVRPAKDGFRYDFEVQGLDPGVHDLRQYLETIDSTTSPNQAPLQVRITTALPEGPPRPHDLAPTEIPKLGGYRTTLLVLGSIWLTGLISILLWRKKKPSAATSEGPPPTLAERLTPLVAAASAGTLSSEDRASLDRLLLAHWRRHLPEISDLPPAEALATLRRHPDSAPLLLALEKWIHSPARTEPENLEELLRPYA